jgi:integrase
MPRTLNRLTALKIDRQKDGTTFCDGGGLYCVADGGSKRWTFRYTLHGRKREMGGGSSDTFSLAEAREWAREMRQLVHRGIDPIESRKEAKAAKKAEQAKAMTFEECATALIKAKESTWTNGKHRAEWPRSLNAFVYPVIGKLPVQMIDTALVVKVLQPIWDAKTETASRVRGRIESIIDWAKVRGFRTGENPAKWDGHLEHLFAGRGKAKHYHSLPYASMPALMVKLRADSSIQARALELLILTATRRDETRCATWSEVDFTERTWTIPAERMKARKPHKVPLCSEAMRVLEALYPLRRADLLFPGTREGRPIDPETMMRLVKELAGPDTTLHGFRASFRTWASERTSYPREIAELALAHTVGSEVERAYQRSDMLEKRRQFMGAWASYLSKPPAESTSVVPMRRA